MAARPQNIGIKAIEVYFPTQVRTRNCPLNSMENLHYEIVASKLPPAKRKKN